MLGEESDFVGGKHISHLELYLDSMKGVGSNTSSFLQVMNSIYNSDDYSDSNLHKVSVIIS